MFIKLPICFQVALGKGQRIIVVHSEQWRFLNIPSRPIQDVPMREAMSSVITHDRHPYAILSHFQLNAEMHDSPVHALVQMTISLGRTNAQRIFRCFIYRQLLLG